MKLTPFQKRDLIDIVARTLASQQGWEVTSPINILYLSNPRLQELAANAKAVTLQD